MSIPELDPAPDDFYAVASVEEIPPGERLFIEVDGKPVVIFNVGGQFYAIGDACTHDNGPLGDGALEGHEVVCPRHGARFDLRDGCATRLPAVKPTAWYPLKVDGGEIYIGIQHSKTV